MSEELNDIATVLERGRKRTEAISSRFEVGEVERSELNAHNTAMRFAIRRLFEIAKPTST
jgi:hypothetical protein